MGKSEKLAVYYTKNVSQSCSMWVSEELSREFSYKLPHFSLSFYLPKLSRWQKIACPLFDVMNFQVITRTYDTTLQTRR